MSRFSALRALLGALLLLLAVGPLRAGADEGESSAPSESRAATDLKAPEVPRPNGLVKGEVATPHFRIQYTARSEGAARELAGRIEEARESFRKTLGRDWPGTTTVLLGVGRHEYEALALGAPPPGWAVALAYPNHNVVLLEAGSLANPEGFSTLQHELCHVALGQIGKDWPHWFQEGLAMHLSGERYGLNQYNTIFRALRQDRLYRLEKLAGAFPERPADVEIAYAESLSFVDYLVDEYGPDRLGMLLDGVRQGESFDVAFIKAFGSSVELKEEAWAKELPARYGWLPLSVGNSLLWLLAASLCVAAFLVRRARKQQRLAELAAEDAAEDAAQRLLDAEATAINPYPPPDPGNPFDPADDFDPFAEEPKGGPVKPTIH